MRCWHSVTDRQAPAKGENHPSDASYKHITGNRADPAAVVGTVAVVTHDEVFIRAQRPCVHGTAIAHPGRIKIGFVKGFAVDMHNAVFYGDGFAGQSDDPLDEVLPNQHPLIQIPAWVITNDYVAPLRRTCMVIQLGYPQPVTVLQRRQHAASLDPHRFKEKMPDKEQKDDQKKCAKQ